MEGAIREFIEAMVYDNKHVLPYEQAIDVLERISIDVIDSL